MIRSLVGGLAFLASVALLTFALACAVTGAALEHRGGASSSPATATTSAPRLTPISVGR